MRDEDKDNLPFECTGISHYLSILHCPSREKKMELLEAKFRNTATNNVIRTNGKREITLTE